MYKVAIFDMDGTIIDSMAKWSTVLEDYVDDLKLVLSEEYKQSLQSIPMYSIINKLHEDYNIPGTPKDSFNNILEIMRYGYLNHFPLKPGVDLALEELRRRNIKMAVATATPERIALQALEKQNLLNYFEFVQTSDKVNLGKSKGEYWQIASRNLGSTMENSIVFEDALYCIETVKKLNGNVVAIADNSSLNDLEKIKILSDYYIEDYKELDYSIFEK